MQLQIVFFTNHRMLSQGIAPTLVLVRIGLGLSTSEELENHTQVEPMHFVSQCPSSSDTDNNA
ncbi:hypothetical protein K435DRAFT_856400 [Dendrothele bispora CBS 962.96]|uniref:Uncharacterized protein n=1 Tax=Dendrothele bispora (strain CBS 962.96) TaxID=1314807 RepID=A0A4S8M958_DENBC|nr:hypothetical protein K435DRAFT_856400 [Dendrothele bispora CBS 962.96]